MTYNEVIKGLTKNGFFLKRIRGSHHIFKNEDGRTVTVSTSKKELPVGTLKSIEKQSGNKF